MRYHVYAHDQGTVDFVYSYDTKTEARAAIQRMREEIEAHPSWWDLVCPWFEITTQPPYRETYTFPDMSGMG
jgi:hypothetical protein